MKTHKLTKWQGLSLLLFMFLSMSISANPFLKGPWPDTDFNKITIDLEEVMSGGPPKDGIPAIDEPKFDSVSEASKWLDPREPVIVLVVAEQARAYPLQLLIYHEIINDEIAGKPVSVTFCPLCNSSVVFDRRLEGRVLDFGTTGLLRKSDMVMYDRQTESWWQQIIGEGIVGEYAGKSLVQIPSSIVSFESFAKAHPEGKVVNQDTGHKRQYGTNPYRGYDDIDQTPFLFRGEIDPRLPPMERVLHIQSAFEAEEEVQKLYPFSELKKQGIVQDDLGKTPLVIFSQAGLLSVLDSRQIDQAREIQAVTAFGRKLDGKIYDFKIKDGKIKDEQTNSTWNALGQATEGKLKGKMLSEVQSGIHFAFAWLAFNPDVDIYKSF